MPYTTEDGGRLNNFADEPRMYRAEPPTKNQKVIFAVLGVGALTLIGGMIFVAFSVS
jgi:hypothetical protein